MEIGIGFMFAPVFHAAMKNVSAARKSMGIRTIFNILGPLSNPAGATRQVVGVYDVKLTDTVARVLKKLGAKRAFVVHGMDCLDEITISGRTKVTELNDGKIRSYFVTPASFGLKRSPIGELAGGSAKANAAIITSVLEGERGPRRDAVLMNASAALVAGSMAKTFKQGVRLAVESIDSGRAHGKLIQLIKLTNR
jgi:anthranilate phosphoribosyltransferase